MADIRASEMSERMRILEYGFDEGDSFVVANVDWWGDTVLITDTDSRKRTFDRDEVVQVLPTSKEE